MAPHDVSVRRLVFLNLPVANLYLNFKALAEK